MEPVSDLSYAQKEVTRWVEVLARLAKHAQYVDAELARRQDSHFQSFVAGVKEDVQKWAHHTWALEYDQRSLPGMQQRAEEECAKARHRLVGVVTAELSGMLLDLDRALETAQAKALQTHADADIAALIDAARSQHTLALHLVSLTGNPQFQRPFDAELLGGDSLDLRQKLRILQLPHNRRIPERRPWEALLALLQTDPQPEQRSSYGKPTRSAEPHRETSSGPDAA